MKKAAFSRALAIIGLMMALAIPSWPQSGRGTITGLVKDSTGSVVPAADVTATNLATGVETKSVTTDAGLYRMPYVPPGKYKITAAKGGFKTGVRDNVDVLITQTVTADFILEVGDINQTIDVSAESPLLESSTSEIGTAANELEVHTWPSMVSDGTRQLQDFIFNSMPGTQGSSWAGSINGSQTFSHEVLIDGITVGRFDINGGNTSEFTPTVDAVSEFKLQTGSLSSQYGNTQTGLTNFGLKSGTNQYHGTAFWLHQNAALNANSWSNNAHTYDAATGKAVKAKNHLNNGGATFGGPIIKNKTFFFFSYEVLRANTMALAGSYDSAPIAAFKQGDFSKLLDPAFTRDTKSGQIIRPDMTLPIGPDNPATLDALGRQVLYGQIYDPATTRQLANGTWVRDPFPGNVIPKNMESLVTGKLLDPKYDIPNPQFPLASLYGETLRQNYLRFSDCCPIMKIDNYSIKGDHVINDKHKLSGSYTYNNRSRLRDGYGNTGYRIPGPLPGPYMAGDKTQATPGWLVRLAEDWTISPTKLNHFGLGYNRFRNFNAANTAFTGEDFASLLGFQGVAGGATFPQIGFSGPNVDLSGSYKYMGHTGTGNEPNGSTVLLDDFTWIKGAHSLKIGVEHRRYYINSRYKNTPGSYSFNSDQTALSNFQTSTGFAYASFFLGDANSAGNGIVRFIQGLRSRTTAFYFQDDWKVNNKLTLNLGIRWDIPTGFTDSKNAMSAMDPTMPNPGADGYLGALAFLGNCTGCTGKTKFWDYYYKEFSPRVGFAYAMSNKLVIRGGYGINYSPPLMDGWNYNLFTGFNGSNNYPAKTGRPGGGQDPAYNWDTPYKAYTGVLPNTDPTQLNYDNIDKYPDSVAMPMVQNWNFGVQYEFPWQTRLEANYIGNHGSRMFDPYLSQLNQADPSKVLSLGDQLLDDISLHPEIPKPFPSFTGTVAQALRPFPQYYGVSQYRRNEGWSNYHSLQATLTKRVSKGLSFLAAYTWSKSLGTPGTGIGAYYFYGQNIYNLKADYGVTSLNRPQDLKITWIYDLPFGKQGKWLKTGALGYIVGGWTVSAIHHYVSGAPLSVYSSSSPSAGAYFAAGIYPDVLLGRDQQIIGSKPTTVDEANGTPYLNPLAFATVPGTSANNVPLHLGNAPPVLPNIRGWARYGENFSLMKKFALPFREGASFELRSDVTNLFNRIGYNNPETDIGDPTRFGRVFGKSGGSRVIQLGARITF